MVDVVDIGANPVEGDPPYKPLLAAGRARVVGFEPAPELKSRMVRPLLANGDLFLALGQVFDADAVFIRDFRRLDLLEVSKLEVLATLLHDLYGSFDIAFLALEEIDRRRGTNLAEKYLRGLNATPGAARFTLARAMS